MSSKYNILQYLTLKTRQKNRYRKNAFNLNQKLLDDKTVEKTAATLI